ncbi:MAG: hypothetical protein ACRD17_00205 [Terriglobales bacterium]
MVAIGKFRSHAEAEEATLDYYRSLTPEQRLEILFELRRQAHPENDAAPEGMARVYRVLKLEPR